jgi:VWFA-related protein
MMNAALKPRYYGLSIRWGSLLVALATLAAPSLRSQETTGGEPVAQKTEPTFTLRVQKNVVAVRVVVRDSKGRTIAGLRKDDFRVADNGKPQEIVNFAVETAPESVSPAQPSGATHPAAPGAEQGSAKPLAYLAFYFDDLNSAFDSIVRSREAAAKFIASLTANERIAIFSSSGTQSLDFTDDRQKLAETLAKLHPVKRLNTDAGCPQINDYLANQIVNLEDPDAYRIVRDEAINDCGLDPRSVSDEVLRMQAQAAYSAYVMQARADLNNLDGVIERLALMPGERQVMFVSDGFMPLEMRDRVEGVVDHALRARVIVSALDGSGLAVRSRESDASIHYAPEGDLTRIYRIYDENRGSEATGTLAEIAEGTGGQFFHNNNDLLEGLRRTLAPPEVIYDLTFSPQKIKYNGAFHTVKVSLVSGHSLTVQARKGYFAPKGQESPELLAKEQIHNAVFSQESIQGLPLTMNTEARQAPGAGEEISVQARLDVRSLPFQQRGERSVDEVTFTVALFDRDGKFISGSQQSRSLALTKTTLADLEKSGLSFQARVPVKAGAYTVRVVVRESQGGEMAALSRPVEMPHTSGE